MHFDSTPNEKKESQPSIFWINMCHNVHPQIGSARFSTLVSLAHEVSGGLVWL